MEQWKPVECPKDQGQMTPIPGFEDAWKCMVCGLEIWGGDAPTAQEYEELVNNRTALQSASQKPFVSRSYVPGTVRGGGAKTGRRRKKKKKPDLQNRYRMIEAESSKGS